MTSQIPFLIGHRGACGHAPENTLASIRKAAELGLHWVEFDVMLSADNHPILFHDDALKRITGRDELVAETAFDTLATLDVGTWYSSAFAAERIPTLVNAFTVLKAHRLGAVVEIKPTEGRGIKTGVMVSIAVRELWPTNLPQPIISSFNEDSLAQARDHAAGIPRALNLYKNLDDWQDKLVTYDCVALHCLDTLLDKATAAAIIKAGYDLRCFTVNDTGRAEELRSWGVCSVFTDFPDRIANGLASI